jgi:hypothetical protein
MRLVRFIENWARLLLGPLVWFEKVVPITKRVADIVAPILGAGFIAAISAIVVEIDRQLVPGWGFPIGACLLGFWVFFTAGRAFETSAGPGVYIGPLQFDHGTRPYPCFFSQLHNGPMPLERIIVKVASADDSGGVKHLEYGLEAHLKGQPPERTPEFVAGEPVQAGLLGVAAFPGSGNPTLFVWTMGDKQNQTISRDLPLAQQPITKIKVGITSIAKEGKTETTQYRTFFVAPDLTAGSYKVVSRWRWLIGR